MATVSSLPPGFEGTVCGILPVPHATQTTVPKQARVNKKVSWASEGDLCQVRLFAAEDAPAQSSIMLQDLLQAKKARFMHALNPVVPVDLPPGFGPSMSMGTKPVIAAIFPSVPWRVPEHFKLDPAWLVMAGGDSKEVFAQKQRENRTLEAVYPRPSAIPESPAEPSEVHLPFDSDDSNTLIIPVVPLEDDELPDVDEGLTPSDSTYERLQESFSGQKSVSPPPGFPSSSTHVKSRNWFPEAPQDNNSFLLATSTASAYGPPITISKNLVPPNGTAVQTMNTFNGRIGSMALPARTTEGGTEPDVAAATAAAYAALQQSNDATMIDRELLIKFLTNPSMLQSLSEKLAQNPPGNHGVNRRNPDSVDHNGMGARGNGRVWNPTMTDQNKGGQRYAEAPAVVEDLHTSHGYDRPPGFGAPPGTNGLGQAPPQPGQGYGPSGSIPLSSISQLSAGYDQPAVSGSGRPISQRGEQYYKDLISQHGRKDEESVLGGAGAIDTGNSYRGVAWPKTIGPDRERRIESAERTERSERPDSRARWAGRDVVEMAALSVRQGDSDQPSRLGQSRGKSRKACLYFSTSRGCRNGSSCAFLHEVNNAERAKRPKPEGKVNITGHI